MIALKLWYDSRSRFFIGVVVMIVIAFLVLWSFYAVNKSMSHSDAAPNAKIGLQTRSELLKVWSNYETIIDLTWYQGFGATSIAILAIILAMGGPLAQSHSVHLTLSLPIRRYCWPVAQAVLTIGLTVTMLIISTAVLLSVGALMGHTYPPGRAALNLLLCAVPTVAWVGLTLAVGSYVLDKARTALIVIPTKFISVFLFTLPVMRAWDIGRLGRPINMHPDYSWRTLLLLIVFAVGGVVLAVRRFERLDY